MWSHVSAAQGSAISQPAAFQGDGPEWRTLRRFHCIHIWEQMTDNVHETFAIYLPTSIFFLGSIPPISCLPSADCYYIFWLVNHNDRKKTSMCIHHISLATFAIVVNKNYDTVCSSNSQIEKQKISGRQKMIVSVWQYLVFHLLKWKDWLWWPSCL